MRSFCLNTIFAAAVLVAGSALPGRAEVLTEVQIQVPFSFNVGNVTLPPGSYEIETHNNGAIIVRAAGVGTSGSVAAFVSPIHEGAGHDASFVRVGGKYFLSSIAFGDGRMVQLPTPRLK